MTNDTNRCQSCSMPVDLGFYGTNADGSEHQEYCRFCWVNGAFVQPELTKAAMIEQLISHYTRVLQMPEAEAKDRATQLITSLKRWQ